MIGASRSCEPLTLQLCEKWMSPPLSGCQSSLMRIGKGSAPHPPSMGPNVPKMRGMTRAKHPTKQRLNSFWFRMYCHGTPKDPDPSALRAAVTSFPFQYKDEGVVQYRQIQEAVRVMWLAAQTSMTRYMRITIPDGIPEWGVDEQELPPMQVMPSRTGRRSRDTLGLATLSWSMPRIGSCLSKHPSGSAPRCACGNGGPFFRGCSTGHLPRTTLDRSCLDVPALSSVKRPIFLSSAPSRWAGCPLLCATTVCEPLGLEC